MGASLLLLFAGLMLGCASPQPVYRLDAQSADSSSVWRQGRRIVTRTVDSVQVAVAYGRTTSEGHKFHIAYANRSGTSRTFDPQNVFGVVTGRRSSYKRKVQVETGEEETEDGPHYEYRRVTLTATDTMPARDPEEMLLRIDRQQARATAEAANDATANALISVLDAVNTFASPAPSPEERTAEASEELSRAADRAENQRTQNRLQQRRAQWAQSALRRTTLLPGERTSGVVYVPVDPRATRLVLHVNVGSRTVTIPFQQTRYES